MTIFHVFFHSQGQLLIEFSFATMTTRLRQCFRRFEIAQPSVTMSTKNHANDSLKVLAVEPTDGCRIVQFLRKHYYPDEPLTIGNEPKKQDPADEEFHQSILKHCMSLMAVQPSPTVNGDSNSAEKEEIVGVVLSAPKDGNEAKILLAEANRLGPTKWGKTLKLLACIERDANIFERYCVKKVFHIHLLAVDGRVRGKAIGGRLMKAAIDLGRQEGYPLVTVDCTGYYSAKLCERLGMECVNSLAYADYLDEKGSKVFDPPSPHVSINTYAMRL